MPLPPKLAETVENLSFLTDRQERIDALISMGEQYRPLPESEVPRDEQHRVPGCESEVFVASRPEGAGLKYLIAVDNPQGISAKALAHILDESLSGQPLEQVAELSEEVVYDIFGRELSMGKSLGLMNTVRAVKTEAARALTIDGT